MVNATINGIDITVEDGTTILAAARKVGVDVPTLCYLKEVNEIGACRVCVVEVEGQDRCVTAGGHGYKNQYKKGAYYKKDQC